MRDEQIVTLWRDARDRQGQVKILAELNDVPRSMIEEILVAHGCEVVKRKQPLSRAMGKKPWKLADDDRLLGLYGAGRSYDEIAETLARTTAAVKQRILNLKRQEEERKMGRTKWTSDEVAFMLERRKQGVDVRHIAAEMGRTTAAIHTKLKKLREDEGGPETSKASFGGSEEGKKIMAEREEEERESVTNSHGSSSLCAVQYDRKETLGDKIVRMVEDYKKAAETVGEAMEIHIDATAESVSLMGTGGTAVIYLREQVLKN